MATRYRVVRQTVRYGKKTYRVGEFMPESFSDRDLYRVLYPSRLEKVEIPDMTTTAEAPEVVTTATQEPAPVIQGNEKAAKTPAAPTKTTGASLSGQSINKK